MKRRLQILALLLLFPIINKVLFLESGVFAHSLYTLSMLCHCNHASENEVHSEDTSTKIKRSTCKMRKGQGIHLCGCSKKRTANKILHSQTFNPSYVTENITGMFLRKLERFYRSEISFQLANGFSHLPYKPPRQTLI
ncbi:MAG: hypothetical protein O9264_15965 [Leptospira sp.]|nr:hypothetical protein [Leptospira sp.]